MKLGIVKLTTSGGQRNLCTIFIFVSCEEKGCYRIVPLGHQILTADRTAGSAAVCKDMQSMVRFEVYEENTNQQNSTSQGRSQKKLMTEAMSMEDL